MEGGKWFLMRRCSQPTKHFLEESPLEIGRSVTAFIICTCPHVSKNHATITYQNGNFIYVRDNMTTNGTYINGHRIESGRFCLLMESDVISFGKPEEDMEDLNSEYCFQLLLEKQKPQKVTNEIEAMNNKVLYIENLIERQLEELHSLAMYSRDCNIAEAESCQPSTVTSKHIQDIEQQLEEIHSSTVPDIAPALSGPILPPGPPQQEPPPKSPAVAGGQDHSDAIPQISRSLQPIPVQAPSLPTISNVVPVNKVKPSPKCKKPNNILQLEPQLESPNISNINDNSTIAPELSRTIKLEIIEANEPVSSTDKDSFQVEQVQSVPIPEPPQLESPAIVKSVPEITSLENVKLPEPSSLENSDTSQSSKDKESKLKKRKNAVQAESDKKDKQDTRLSKSKKPQTISIKEPSVSKKRASQSAIDDSSSKAKKPKKALEKEPVASTNSKHISQSVIDDGPSNAKRQKKNVSEQKPPDTKVKNAPFTDNSSKTNKHTKLPEKDKVSNRRTSLADSGSSDKSSHKTRKSVDKKPLESSSKRTSKCENENDNSSKGRKSKVSEKDPPMSKTRSTSREKSSSNTKTPKKDSSDSKSRNSSKDDSYSKSKKGKNPLEEEPSVSKRRSSQSAKDTSSSKTVTSKNKEPSDSDKRRTSKADKNSTSTETKRSKESKSSSVFKITDGNLNKERRDSLSANMSPDLASLTERVKIQPRSMSMVLHAANKSNRRQSIMIDPLPSVTRRSSRIKAKLDTSETMPKKLPKSNQTPLRHRSKSVVTINDSKPIKKTNEKPKAKKNHDASETLKEMQAKILSQLSFLAPPLQSTVERLAGSIRPRSYSMHDLAPRSIEETPLVPARICPPGILKRPSTDHRITLKIRPRSYSIVERSVTFAPGTHDNQKDNTSQSSTGGESSDSLNKTIKYGRSYSTIGFASTTSPTHSAQAASIDIWNKRTGEESSHSPKKSTKFDRSYSTVGFASTTSPTQSAQAAPTDSEKKRTGEESPQSLKNSTKYSRSYSTVGFASTTSPTLSTQVAPTDIGKKKTGEGSSQSLKKSTKYSRSYSTIDFVSTSSPTQSAQAASADIEKKKTGEESSQSLKRSTKYSRSYSTVDFASTSSPTQSAPTDIEKKKTGEESSQSLKNSTKYGRSYSTVGVASATSPTQAAPTDVWKKREDPRRRPSIASHILEVLTQTTHQTADSTTDQISECDSGRQPGTSEPTSSAKPSYSTHGRIIDPNPESKETAKSSHNSNARETPATVSSHRNKPMPRSYTMCDTLVSGKFTKEQQSKRNFLGNQSPRTPSPGGQSPGTSSSRGGLERSTSYLGTVEGNQVKQDRVGRKTNYDGDRRMSMYVPKAPSEESLPEYHKTFLSHIIRWNPAWLAEYMMHDTLPPIFHETKTDIPVMMYTYKNFEVYSDTQVCLVILEVWEAAFAAYKETREKNDELDFTLQCSPPKAYTGTKITKVTLKINSKGIVTNGSRSVCYGTLLLVKFPELPKCSNHWFLAMIEDTEYKNLANGGKELLVSIYVKLDPWQIASLSPNAVAKVKLLNSIKNELGMVRAVYELQTSKLLEQIVSPRAHHFRKFTNLSPMQWKHDLNPSQLKAVSQCICALTSGIPDIQIIQGPPGTGKSRVIVSIVMEYLQRTIRHNRGKVLICAQTNVAIDELVLRLLEAREKMSASGKKFSMVRVGRCESMHPRALTISSTEMAKQFDNYPDIRHQISVLRKQIEKYSYRRDSVGPQAAYFKVQHQHYTKKLDDLVSFHSSPNTLYHEEMAIIEKADVIATTLQGCSLGKIQGLRNKITFCIVDEAAKATEPEILIPLSLGVNNLVMVGDHQQLAAFVMSQHAKKHGLSESLFSRLIHCCEFSENSSMLPLNIQYRMHPDIAQFPNLAFYEGKLQDGRSNSPTSMLLSSSALPSPSALPLAIGMPPLCGLPPYRVVEVRGRSGDQDESGANSDEAKVVARLALAIDTHVRENELNLSLCVLTPYTAQREAIQHKLRNLTTRRIEVSTVDSFQGQERDVVVVSCARSSGIGFLDDPGRMSVLLTRAKKSCIVCCNPEALCEHSLWAALISDADARLMLRPLPQTMPPYMNEEDNCRRFMSYLQ